MKTIRYFAALLMLISGVWRLIDYFRISSDYGLLPLAFGVLYLLIGLLLLRPKMIGVYLGLLTFVPLILTPFVTGQKALDRATVILLLIDLVVFICCVYLILVRKKAT